MPMSTYAKHRLAEAMRRTADANTCPKCGRRAAMVIRYLGDRHHTWCQWIDRGKCESTPDNDTRETRS